MHMRFDYLKRESEMSLAPFFSKQVLTSIRFYMACLLLSSLLLWPRNPLSFFIENHETPVFFPAVFMTALFLISHLSLRYCRGEMSKVDYMTNLLKKEILTHEESQPFIMYAFLNFLFFNVYMLLLSAPLFIASASVSGIETIHILQSVILVFLFSFLSGLTGFITYLLLGRWKITGYLLSRILYGFLLFGAGLISMTINPFYIIYSLYKNIHQVTLFNLNTVTFYLGLLLILILFLSVISQIMISYKEKKRFLYAHKR